MQPDPVPAPVILAQQAHATAALQACADLSLAAMQTGAGLLHETGAPDEPREYARPAEQQLSNLQFGRQPQLFHQPQRLAISHSKLHSWQIHLCSILRCIPSLSVRCE